DGQRIDAVKTLKICLTFVFGGLSTTSKGTRGALWYLGCHPETRQEIIESPELLPPAIEEFLRYFSPVPILGRTATRDVCFAGANIRQGDHVMLGWGAANRDPKAFECPNTVDIHREKSRHLAMGIGEHFCIGATLGRMELRVMIEEVLSRMPDYTLVDDSDER